MWLQRKMKNGGHSATRWGGDAGHPQRPHRTCLVLEQNGWGGGERSQGPPSLWGSHGCGRRRPAQGRGCGEDAEPAVTWKPGALGLRWEDSRLGLPHPPRPYGRCVGAPCALRCCPDRCQQTPPSGGCGPRRRPLTQSCSPSSPPEAGPPPGSCQGWRASSYSAGTAVSPSRAPCCLGSSDHKQRDTEEQCHLACPCCQAPSPLSSPRTCPRPTKQ